MYASLSVLRSGWLGCPYGERKALYSGLQACFAGRLYAGDGCAIDSVATFVVRVAVREGAGVDPSFFVEFVHDVPLLRIVVVFSGECYNISAFTVESFGACETGH